jgi:hypothetical protein
MLVTYHRGEEKEIMNISEAKIQKHYYSQAELHF